MKLNTFCVVEYDSHVIHAWWDIKKVTWGYINSTEHVMHETYGLGREQMHLIYMYMTYM